MNEKIKYRIFDKNFKHSSHMYGKYRFDEHEQNKIQEVISNYQKVLNEFQAEHLLILNQVHGHKVIDADEVVDFSQEPTGDAAVSSKAGVVLAIQTADCVPVLLASLEGLIVAAVHCGWRSAHQEILSATVALMKKKGAGLIQAIIGPAIHQEAYEVDQAFYEQIVGTEAAAASLFILTPKSGHYYFNLPAFVKLKLQQLGITEIRDVCHDTYSNPDLYYSYRRDGHLGIQDNKARNLSCIMRKT